MTERQKADVLVDLLALGVTAWLTFDQLNDKGFSYAPGTKFWYSVATKSEKFAKWAWTQYRAAAPYYDK